jgi:hypothetical protein
MQKVNEAAKEFDLKFCIINDEPGCYSENLRKDVIDSAVVSAFESHNLPRAIELQKEQIRLVRSLYPNPTP